MTLGELLDEFGNLPADQLDYKIEMEIRLEDQQMVDLAEPQITARFDHQNKKVTLELTGE